MAAAPSSSACTKGFAISSLPSRGEMRTRRVPRATRRPRGLDEVLPSSSVFWCMLALSRAVKRVHVEREREVWVRRRIERM